MAAPTITGTVANQPVTGNDSINPFSAVTFADADGDELDIIVNLDAIDQPGGVREGTFTDASVAASGFTFNSGVGNWSFHGTAAAATAAIRLLVWDPNEPVGGDGVSHLSVAVFDGPGAPDVVNTATTILWIAGANSPPAITSNGGTNSATVQVNENKTLVTTVTSDDPDGDGPDYAIIGGADAAKFTLGSGSGDLRFIIPPDFETPTDKNADGIYEVIVEVADGHGGSDKQRIFVAVNDILGVVINGGPGPDVVNENGTVDGQPDPGKEGDTINGKGNRDQLSGLAGNDVLNGDGGNDTLSGGAGADEITGDAGDDTVTGGAGLDLLDGGAGIDTADYSDKTNSVIAELNGDQAIRVDLVIIGDEGPEAVAEDLIKNFENLIGGSAKDLLGGDSLNNVLKGNDAADSLFGFDGDDTLVGGAGKDKLNGGDGSDTADYSDKSNKVVVDLSSGNAQGRVSAVIGREVDTLTVIENITGGSGDDELTGNDFTNTLRGNDGNDVLSGIINTQPGSVYDQLFGGDGDDSLHAGEGGVILTGGSGADRFIFNTIPVLSRISDFSHKDDTIQLSHALFGDMGKNADGTGVLKAEFFHVIDDLTQLEAGVNFLTSHDELYYWTGTPIEFPRLLATVENATLAANDFLVL